MGVWIHEQIAPYKYLLKDADETNLKSLVQKIFKNYALYFISWDNSFFKVRKYCFKSTYVLLAIIYQ